MNNPASVHIWDHSGKAIIKLIRIKGNFFYQQKDCTAMNWSIPYRVYVTYLNTDNYDVLVFSSNNIPDRFDEPSPMAVNKVLGTNVLEWDADGVRQHFVRYHLNKNLESKTSPCNMSQKFLTSYTIASGIFGTVHSATVAVRLVALRVPYPSLQPRLANQMGPPFHNAKSCQRDRYLAAEPILPIHCMDTFFFLDQVAFRSMIPLSRTKKNLTWSTAESFFFAMFKVKFIIAKKKSLPFFVIVFQTSPTYYTMYNVISPSKKKSK